MSWLSRIKDIKLTIVTGDGKEYQPLWREARKNINFNNEAFDFIGVRGTFVERKEVQGTQYPILMYFQGDDCIDQALQFEISTRDPRPWTIKHPFYDNITVQPLSLEFDNSQYNVSKITGTLWETIEQKYPDDRVNPQQEVIAAKEISDETVTDTFTDDIETPSPTVIEKSQTAISKISGQYETLSEKFENIQRLKDLTRSASAAAQEIISTPTRYMRQMIDLINYPFTVIQNIQFKIDSMISVFEDLTSIFMTDQTSDDEIIYQSQATVLLTELSRNIVNSVAGEYDTRASVLEVVSTVTEVYSQFTLQMESATITQDKQMSKDLDYIVNLALGALYDIAFESKQQREYIVEKDSNVITLAHRFFGKGEENIDAFILQNNIALNEYLVIKKGRKINYFV